MREVIRGQDFRAPRRPEVIDQREAQKKLMLRLHCACGACVFEILHRKFLAAPATNKLLVQQAHRAHQRATGCTLGLV